MKFRNFILFIITLVGCSGCYFKTATYEIFKYKRDGELYEWNNQNIPKYHSERREIYDDNRYIYKFNGEDPRCVYGYLTNRNDKIEKVVGWVILSGKEYCKETLGVGIWM